MSIFEIGRRLNWVKDNNLAHGQFLGWLKSINMSRQVAEKFMRIERNLPNSYSSNNLGWRPLYEIATMQPEDRNKTYRLNDGQNKKPVDMTVRELREIKRKLKEQEQTIANQQAELEDNRKTQIELNQRLSEAHNHQPEPQVVTKTVTKEVKPDDYDKLKADQEQFESRYNQLAQQLADTRKRMGKLADNYDKTSEKLRDYEDAEHQERKAEHWKNRGRVSVYKVRSHIKDFLISNELGKEDREAALDSGEEALNSLNQALDDLQDWIDDKRSITGGRRTVEGEIIND